MAITVTLAETKMKDGSTKLQLKTPYSPTLPALCRALGGKWNATQKSWFFDMRDARRVAAMCLETFGIDPLAAPDDAPDLVTVRWRPDQIRSDEVWMFGRQIVRRPGRDSAVQLGADCVTVSGGFPTWGGSRANPVIGTPVEGTIIEIRDVPRSLVDETLAQYAAQAKRYQELADAAVEVHGDGGGDGGNIASYRAIAEHARAALTIVEDAPEVERVSPAIQQAVALAKAMGPNERRSTVMAILAVMTPDERNAMLKEITLHVEQVRS